MTSGKTQRLFSGPAPAPSSGDDPTKIGPYTVLRLLGEGGVGRVFECKDEMLDRKVAVKLLRPERAAEAEHAARFLREARAMAKVQSPHVVAIFFVGEHEGAPYLVMERLDGDDLNVVLRDQGKLAPLRAVDAMLEAVAGLKAAAAAGLVHRDVKPANLFLHQGHVKVMDFGLARPVDGSADVTHAGLIVGTPYYLAPEIIRSQPATAQSDMYALGATLYELLTGEPPFDAPTAVEIMAAHRALPAPSLLDRCAEAGPALDAVVAKLLQKDPTKRCADWGELEEALRDARRTLPGGDRRARATTQVPAPPAGATTTTTPSETGALPFAESRFVEIVKAGTRKMKTIPAPARIALPLTIAAVVVLAVALLASGDRALDRIDDGHARDVLAELDAIPAARRDARTELVRGHALWALGEHKDALAAYDVAVAGGAVDARALKALVLSLDADKATAAKALLKKWPAAAGAGEALRGALDEGPWRARRHALEVLEQRGEARAGDVERVGVQELLEGPSCARRKEGLELLAAKGAGDAVLDALARAKERMPDNTCMKGAFDEAAAAIKARR